MTSPKVSVIIPAYNSEKFILRCLRSIFQNSLNRDEYEIIVINDGSSDKTEQILDIYRDEIIYIKNKTNQGLPSSLNKGIKNSRGQFIVRVDSDDYVHKDYLYILMLHLQLNNKIDAIACDYYVVDDIQDKIDYRSYSESPIGCGIMFRSDQLVDIGMYDKNFMYREDEDLKIRFGKKYKIEYVKIPLYRYHLHGENMTSNKKLMDDFKTKLENKHK